MIHMNEELSQSLILDGTKIQWYTDRIKKWEKGEKRERGKKEEEERKKEEMGA